MVLLEAMALGKPVVAIDVGGVRNAVEDGETGLLARRDHPADFADSLLRLADDRGFAARLGARSRERQIARFSSERMVDTTRGCSRASPPEHHARSPERRIPRCRPPRNGS